MTSADNVSRPLWQLATMRWNFFQLNRSDGRSTSWPRLRLAISTKRFDRRLFNLFINNRSIVSSSSIALVSQVQKVRKQSTKERAVKNAIEIYLIIHKSSPSHSPLSAAPSSPAASISLIMSSPPTSSPATYTWGYVGQSENFLRPCRTSSSVRMSKVSYSSLKRERIRFNVASAPPNGPSDAHPASWRIWTRVLLNPQRGVRLSPFMNTIILCLSMSFLSLSSSDSSAAGRSSRERLWFLTAAASLATSTPSTRSTILPPLSRTTVGTASTWERIEYDLKRP